MSGMYYDLPLIKEVGDLEPLINGEVLVDLRLIDDE
ncbi:hypothetical protein Cal6303_0624 [Calothrix sp. PCC 6303]|nr:hypothetical protein Cal6303_0624 [Calothrix sp. PCC 6303]